MLKNKSDRENLTTAEKLEMSAFLKTKEAVKYVYELGPYAVSARRNDITDLARKELLYLREVNEEARKSGNEPPALGKGARELSIKDGVVISAYRAKVQERNAFEQTRDNERAAFETLHGQRVSDTHER